MQSYVEAFNRDTPSPTVSPRAIFWLVLVNLVIRGIWLMYMHPPQTSDFLYYYQHAVQLYHGEGFINHGHVSAFWPIGYPIFLALLFHITGIHVLAGQIAQALLSTATVVVVYLFLISVHASAKMALAGGIGYTLIPTGIAWNSVLGTEELCTFLIALSLLLYVRYLRGQPARFWLLAVAGLMMGFACDVREVVALYPFFLFLVEWLIDRKAWRQTLRRVLIFAVFLYAGVAPVTIRNALVMHHFILVSLNGGQNLWQGLHSNGGFYWSNNPHINPILKGGSDEFLRDRIGKQFFFHYAMHHPWRIIVNGLKKMGDLYRYDQSVYYFFKVVHMPGWSGIPYIIVLYASTWFYRLWMIVALVGVYGVFRLRSVPWRTMVVPCSYIAYNTLLMSVFPAWDRFRVPMMPEWAMMFGIGAVVLIGGIQHRRRKRSLHDDVRTN